LYFVLAQIHDLKAKVVELNLSRQEEKTKRVHAELISGSRMLRRNAFNKQIKRRVVTIAQLNSKEHKNEIVMERLEEKFHMNGNEFSVEVKEAAIETAGITRKHTHKHINILNT
jgi:hypothetical protein